MVKQPREDRAVRVGEGGLADLALQDEELVPERKDLDVFLTIAHRQQAQERQRVDCGEVGQAQQHDATRGQVTRLRVIGTHSPRRSGRATPSPQCSRCR
ncbi:hypothetical protein ACWC9T_37425 [Kitasatospora sp. NPDC001159]